jgi:predicted nucleic acid-binding protein
MCLGSSQNLAKNTDGKWVSVTADSNIYISALNFRGNPDKLLDLARAGQIELHITDDILGEVLRVLKDTLRTTRFWTARLPENRITSLAAINTC